MKRWVRWVQLLVLLVLLPNVASAAGVGIWRFDEGTGATLSDESPYSNHGQRVESNPGTTTFTSFVAQPCSPSWSCDTLCSHR